MATTNYGWTLPTVGGSEDTWGDENNALWDGIDALLGGVNATEFSYLTDLSTEKLNYLTTITANSTAPKKMVFTTSGTYTPSANARFALVEMKGGGGAGGGAAVSAAGALLVSVGGGGGAGGEIVDLIDLSTFVTATITIGSGGTGVLGAVGNAGGDTSWSDGTNVWTATGGGGGGTLGGANAGFAPPGSSGGTTFTGASPLIQKDGISGYYGTFLGRNVSSNETGASGNGGDGPAGVIVRNVAGSTRFPGVSANRAGAGGSGAACLATNGSPSEAGGNGQNGIVIITEFF